MTPTDIHAAVIGAIGCVAFGLYGCGGAADSPAIAITDSVGVRVVAYDPDIELPEWRVAAEPALALGEVADRPEYELYRPLHALRLLDGRVVVANQGTEELRFYAADGSHLRTVGRKGGGPGEYEDLWGLALFRGDSLGAWDWTAKRLTLYDDAGRFSRLVSPRDAGGFVPRLLGPLGAGAFAIIAGFDPTTMFAAGSGVRDDSVIVLRIDLDGGAVLDSLGPFPSRQQYVEVGEGTLSVRPVPFGRDEHLDVSADRLWVGDDRAGEIRVYRPDGVLESIVRRRGGPPTVTDADLDAYRAERLEDVAESERPEARRRLESIPPADHLPAFAGLFADRLGRLWLAEFSTDHDHDRRWTIHGPDGRPVARLRLPPRVEPLDAGADYLLVYSRDDLDVEHVVLYTLLNTESSA